VRIIITEEVLEMKKICIVYASMSGNTEKIADRLRTNLQNDFEIELLEMENLEASVLLKYDGILIGSYTWGDGELPFEAEDFYEELDELDLTGKVIGCFGSGDHAYPQFCASVDQLQEKVIERGAEVVKEGLKIELAPETEEDFEQCFAFAKQFSELLKAKAS
jgi:flavodoxin I